MDKSVTETAAAIRTGEISAREMMEHCLAVIAGKNDAINAFVFLDEDAALATADRIDREHGAGTTPGPLAGVPFAIKDLRDRCAGMPTRNGSLITADALPDETDTVHIARLKAAGAIPIGKVATAEFGLDGVTHTLAHGTTRNPWNPERTPSGSSGGSSAAVSAGMVPFATGGDGLGSIRCPAGFTGLVGLKPSLGRIPRGDGFADTASPGAVTMTVADTARYLDVVAGPDDHDRMTLPAAGVSYEQAIESLDVRGLRAIWSTDLGFAPVEPEVASVCRTAANALVEAAGLHLVADHFSCTNPYIAWNALAAVKLREQFEYARYLPDHLDQISPGPRRFIERYAYQDSRQLVEYQETVKRTEQELAELFARADVLLTPTACCVPYAAEGPLPEVIAGKDASQTNGEPFTALGSIGWNPSISVPAGISSDGLPIGLLINVRRHRDDIALRLARISEQANPWPRRPTHLHSSS
jgi:aspartyl-tRNA(Asn)/glutamyl-tRNA(Gln) amidotransferase subunit A